MKKGDIYIDSSYRLHYPEGIENISRLSEQDPNKSEHAVLGVLKNCPKIKWTDIGQNGPEKVLKWFKTSEKDLKGPQKQIENGPKITN